MTYEADLTRLHTPLCR